jgi:hypothetical protein
MAQCEYPPLGAQELYSSDTVDGKFGDEPLCLLSRDPRPATLVALSESLHGRHPPRSVRRSSSLCVDLGGVFFNWADTLLLQACDESALSFLSRPRLFRTSSTASIYELNSLLSPTNTRGEPLPDIAEKSRFFLPVIEHNGRPIRTSSHEWGRLPPLALISLIETGNARRAHTFQGRVIRSTVPFDREYAPDPLFLSGSNTCHVLRLSPLASSSL